MLQFYDIEQSKQFIQLRQSILSSASQKKARGVTTSTLGLSLRNDVELMIECENCVKEILWSLHIDSRPTCMQFPINVRVVNEPNRNYNHDFDTHFVHIDAWSGAPKRSFNLMIYLDIEGDPACVDFYRFISSESNDPSSFKGGYVEAGKMFPSEKIDTPDAKIGQAIIFDQAVPHCTQTKAAGGTRVSLDVRFRIESPYIDDDGTFIGDGKFLDYSPGNPGWGYYWTLPPSGTFFKSFDEKVSFELSEARKIGPKAEMLRLAYVERVMMGGNFCLRRKAL